MIITNGNLYTPYYNDGDVLHKRHYSLYDHILFINGKLASNSIVTNRNTICSAETIISGAVRINILYYKNIQPDTIVDCYIILYHTPYRFSI